MVTDHDAGHHKTSTLLAGSWQINSLGIIIYNTYVLCWQRYNIQFASKCIDEFSFVVLQDTSSGLYIPTFLMVRQAVNSCSLLLEHYLHPEEFHNLRTCLRAWQIWSLINIIRPDNHSMYVLLSVVEQLPQHARQRQFQSVGKYVV